MTKEEFAKYRPTDELRELLAKYSGMKFKLDCGHHITWGHSLGNDVTILNGKELKIICSLCGH